MVTLRKTAKYLEATYLRSVILDEASFNFELERGRGRGKEIEIEKFFMDVTMNVYNWSSITYKYI